MLIKILLIGILSFADNETNTISGQAQYGPCHSACNSNNPDACKTCTNLQNELLKNQNADYKRAREKECQEATTKYKKAQAACKSLRAPLSSGENPFEKCEAKITTCLNPPQNTLSVGLDFCSRAAKEKLAKSLDESVDKRGQARIDAMDKRNQVEDEIMKAKEDLQKEQADMEQKKNDLREKLQQKSDDAIEAATKAIQDADKNEEDAQAKILSITTQIQSINTTMESIRTVDRSALISRYAAAIAAKVKECRATWEKEAKELQAAKNTLIRNRSLRFRDIFSLAKQTQSGDDPRLSRQYKNCVSQEEAVQRLYLKSEEDALKAKMKNAQDQINALNKQINLIKELTLKNKARAQQFAQQQAQKALTTLQSMNQELLNLEQASQKTQQVLQAKQQNLLNRYNNANKDYELAKNRYEKDLRELDTLERQGVRPSSDNSSAQDELTRIRSSIDNVTFMESYIKTNCKLDSTGASSTPSSTSSNSDD